MSEEPKEILRKEPGPAGRWFFRAPIYVYRLGLGGLLGRRMVLIEHTGRTSGLPRQTVLESVRYDDDSIDVAAAWGTKSDWYRNLEAEPRLKVSSGRMKGAPATSSVLDEKTAESVFTEYTEAHPKSAQALGKTFGLPFDDAAQMAAAVPLVRLTIDTPDAAGG